MTVQELINKLRKIKNKSKLVISYDETNINRVEENCRYVILD